MDSFLESLLAERGCTVDGSTSRNPISQIVDRVFESNLGYLGYDGSGDLNEQIAYSIDGQTLGPSTMDNTNTNLFMMDQSQHHVDNIFSGSMQHQQMMMMQTSFFHQQLSVQQQQQDYQQHLRRESDHQLLRQQQLLRTQEIERRESFLEAAQLRKLSQSQTQDALRDYNSMWRQQKLSNYAVTKEGYTEAWNQLQEKLENGEYIMRENNPYKDEENSFEIGMQLYNEGKVNDAIFAFEAATVSKDEDAEAWRMLGCCHSENDDDKKAILCLSKAVDYDPYNIESLLALGTSYVNELEPQKALETLKSWVSHNPKFQGLSIAPDEFSDGTLMDTVQQLMAR